MKMCRFIAVLMVVVTAVFCGTLQAGLVTGAADLVLGQQNFTGNSSGGTGSTMYGPTHAAIDSTGRLYVSDSCNNRVLWWNSADGLVNGQDADGVIGQLNLTSTSANQGGAVSSNTLNAPYGVQVDCHDNVWVADTSNCRVLKFHRPAANNESAALVLGQQNFSEYYSNRGGDTAANSMGYTENVHVDRLDRVWVADCSNNRVLMYNNPQSDGADADLVLGQGNFISYSPGTSAGEMYTPYDIATDSSALVVWVLDCANSRVLRFTNPLTNGATADLVLGQADFIHGEDNRGGAVAANTMKGPESVAVDPEGRVWVADRNNYRILMYRNPQSNGMAADLVLGQADFVHGSANRGGGTSAYGMDALEGVYADRTGNIWASDYTNNRVVKYNLPRVLGPDTYAGVSGSAARVTMAGQELAAGMVVRLRRQGQSDITATDVEVSSSTRMSCTFNLANAAAGNWDIVSSSGAIYGIYRNGFQVQQATASQTGTGTVDSSTGADITISPDSGQITVAIAAGTFGQSVTMTVATATVPSSGQSTVKVTNIGLEITNSAGLQPLQAITITVYYRDSDITGLDESKLTLARYDTENSRWIAIPTVVYADQNKLVGTVQHLSTFAVVQLAPASDLAGVKAYPNPFSPKKDAQGLTIANLTGEATLKIYNVAGELIAKPAYSDGGGIAHWYGRNDSGNSVASGVYLLFIDSPQGKKTLKIAVEK